MKPIKCDICKRETETAYYNAKFDIAGKGKGEHSGSYRICIPCMQRLFKQIRSQQ